METKEPELAYGLEESRRAWDEWGANCGPHSIAAATGNNLETVRKALGRFPGWMSPTMIRETLLKLKWVQRWEPVGPKSRVPFKWKMERERAREIHAKARSIARVQYEGPWLDPKADPVKAYYQTHWVAFQRKWVLDTTQCSFQWIEASEWKVLFDTHCQNEGYEGWHFTHWLHLEKAKI